jgi:hypothetical protein
VNNMPDNSALVAVVHDIRKLSPLVATHGLEAVINAHVHALESLLVRRPAARRGGIHLVQDLRELGVTLALQMADPRLLPMQARAALFPTRDFPVRWRRCYIVDAPAVFATLWSALATVLPAQLIESVRFVERPAAIDELESFFGFQVLSA